MESYNLELLNEMLLKERLIWISLIVALLIFNIILNKRYIRNRNFIKNTNIKYVKGINYEQMFYPQFEEEIERMKEEGVIELTPFSFKTPYSTRKPIKLTLEEYDTFRENAKLYQEVNVRKDNNVYIKAGMIVLWILIIACVYQFISTLFTKIWVAEHFINRFN